MATPSRAGLLIERGNALAAGKSGAGNIMPKEWMDLWLQSYSLNQDQAAKAHGLASTFYADRGRQADEGEIDDIYRQVTSGRLAGSDPNPGQTAQVPAFPATFQPTFAQGRTPLQLAQARGLTPAQMAYWVDQMGDFQRTRGRAPDEGEVEQLIATARTRAVAPNQAAQKQVAKPWQVNPAVWDSLGNMGQQLALSFAEDEGWDAGDYQAQINATRPQGYAPKSVTTQYAQPRGLSR